MRIPDELYAQIQRSLPIACVDLLVTDAAGRVLMLRRRNPPARGEWWFPGGRVLFGERRHEAALRKLREECGLDALSLRELVTCDVFVEGTHAVTTVFHVSVAATAVRLDDQSVAHEWRVPAGWLAEVSHEFLREVLAVGV
jgi:colanic acid biosynthesis protein WcaH